jgi:hypothetical protein
MLVVAAGGRPAAYKASQTRRSNCGRERQSCALNPVGRRRRMHSYRDVDVGVGSWDQASAGAFALPREQASHQFTSRLLLLRMRSSRAPAATETDASRDSGTLPRPRSGYWSGTAAKLSAGVGAALALVNKQNSAAQRRQGSLSTSRGSVATARRRSGSGATAGTGPPR